MLRNATGAADIKRKRTGIGRHRAMPGQIPEANLMGLSERKDPAYRNPPATLSSKPNLNRMTKAANCAACRS